MYPGAVAGDALCVKDTGLYCCLVLSPEIIKCTVKILKMWTPEILNIEQCGFTIK